MLSHSQGRGYAATESSPSALNADSVMLTCTNPVGGAVRSAQTGQPGHGSCTVVFEECPMCGKQPLEPVRVDGQLACRGCTSACTICGWPCIPGDDACGECIRLVVLDRQAVLT